MSADGFYIINKLLDKYEDSPFAKGAVSRQSVKIRCASDAVIQSSLEDAVAKDEFLSALDALSSASLISYTTEKGQLMRIINHIILNLDKLDDAYAYVHRIPLKDQILSLCSLLDETDIEDADISGLLSSIKNDVLKKFRLVHPFSADTERNRRIINVLEFISNVEVNVFERVMSLQLFKDSKCFERNIRKDVVSLLKQLRPDSTSDSILPSFGIIKYPEVIEFTGSVKSSMFDYSPLTNGAYINSLDIAKLDKLSVSASKIITIENKANYYQHVQHRADELVIYTGGFPSPSLSRFLSLVYASASDAIFQHFGDIDLGGFMIFNSIRKTIPSVMPYMMDVATLQNNLKWAAEVEDTVYLSKLEKLLSDDSYQIFHPLIKLMLDKKVRLEQEALIV